MKNKKKSKKLFNGEKKKRRKRSTRVKLKEKAWKIFSEYIRRKYADSRGFVRCYCGKIVHWKESQASHLVPGRADSILFDERGVYPSCIACNMFKGGNIHAYMRFLEGKFGINEAITIRDELLVQSKKAVKLTEFDLEEIINKYTSLLKELDES